MKTRKKQVKKSTSGRWNVASEQEKNEDLHKKKIQEESSEYASTNDKKDLPMDVEVVETFVKDSPMQPAVIDKNHNSSNPKQKPKVAKAENASSAFSHFNPKQKPKHAKVAKAENPTSSLKKYSVMPKSSHTSNPIQKPKVAKAKNATSAFSQSSTLSSKDVVKIVADDAADLKPGSTSSLKTDSVMPKSSHTGDDKEASISSSSTLQVFKLDSNQCLAKLDYPGCFAIKGKVELNVLHGSVKVMGHLQRDSQTKPLPIYSPTNQCQVTVCTMPSDTSPSLTKPKRKLIKLLNISQLPEDLLKFITHMNQNCVLCLIQKLESDMCDFLTSVSSLRSLFPAYVSDVSDMLKASDISNRRAGGSAFKSDCHDAICANVCDVTNRVNGRSIILICGGLKVGKSTLGRFIINSLLNKYESVGHLECDVGQTEFTPTGCLAFTVIREPLLGPAFTHQKQTVRTCYFGGTTPSENPRFYLECLEYVHRAYLTMNQNVPLVVNTMGWISGVGLSLLVETMRLLQPSMVLQVMSSMNSRNMAPLTLCTARNVKRLRVIKQDLDKQYQLVQVPAQVLGRHMKGSNISAANIREMSILAYYSKLPMLKPTIKKLFTVTPHTVAWSTVAVKVSFESVPNHLILQVLNCSHVALCKVPTDSILEPDDASLPRFLNCWPAPICECLGFGFVRSICMEQKVFHILSPISVEELSTVNCLVKGKVDMADTIVRQTRKKNNTNDYISTCPDVLNHSTNREKRKIYARKESQKSIAVKRLVHDKWRMAGKDPERMPRRTSEDNFQ